MKANELRIGNYISIEYMNHEEETILDQCDVVCISGTGALTLDSLHDDDQVFTYLEDCKPIPLTEEWLLKFGFEKIKYPYVDGNGLECDLFESYWGDFYKVEDYYLPRPYYFADAFGDNFKLKYVHQLQNLYFALTGEELTIKQ